MRFDEPPDDGVRRDPAARRNLNTLDQSSYVPARILFPALGFPAVIAPGSSGPAISTRTICALVLTSRKWLSKADVARHLRLVPWDQRHKRWLPAQIDGGTNAFAEEHIEVRRREALPAGKEASLTELVSFGVDVFGTDPFATDPTATNADDSKYGILVGLSRFVREFYAKHKLRYLFEIRIVEHASAGLPHGLHNLFWINPDEHDDEDDRSAEIGLLMEYARESRFKNDGLRPLSDFAGKTREVYEQKYQGYLQEYEYDFRQPQTGVNRTEVLHPVFIREAPQRLCIGHLTDLHVDIRSDAYERNLKTAGSGGNYHNWNTACRNLYKQARGKCDILLLTGDLIDYGRGYNEIGPLGENKSYWRDRDWFLFYEVLANGTNYEKPAYTNLGNHDWRINPYPPFAPGAPNPLDMATIGTSAEAAKEQLVKAHGVGYDAGKSYDPLDGSQWAEGLWKKRISRDGNLAVHGTPIETRVESVAWYLLLINPFLDYASPLPGGYNLLMLDWANEEVVDRHVIVGGVDYGPTLLLPNTNGGPMAKNCITKNQAQLVEYTAEHFGPKILGIHAPVLGPWPHWYDDQLATGRIKFTPDDASSIYRLQRDGETDGEYKKKQEFARGATVRTRTTYDSKGNEVRTERIYEHAALALRASKDDPTGQEADYGSFVSRRDWLIKKLRESKFHVVLSGHIHRRNLLIVDVPQMENGRISDYYGELTIKDIKPADAPSAPQPLFVNSTSAGPQGHYYVRRGDYRKAPSGYTEVCLASSGKIESVEYKALPVVRSYPSPVFR